MIKQIKSYKIKGNPNNPRVLKNSKFKQLVQSIREFPEMLKIRPIVVDENLMILGGNMRWKASQDAGLKEIWIYKADNLSEKKKQEFIIKDNVNFGEWNWDLLGNEWDSLQLAEWGLDVWQNEDDLQEPDFNELTEDNNNKPPTMKITFKNKNDLENAEKDIAEIVDKYEKAFYSVSAGEL